MGLLKTFFNNTGRPAGFLGRVMLWSMNWGHAPVADWGMGFIPGSVRSISRISGAEGEETQRNSCGVSSAPR